MLKQRGRGEDKGCKLGKGKTCVFLKSTGGDTSGDLFGFLLSYSPERSRFTLVLEGISSLRPHIRFRELVPFLP